MALTNLATIMDAIATTLQAAGVAPRADGFPVATVNPPHIVVSYPETITFDLTMARGADTITIPIFLMLGEIKDKSARDALSAAIDGAAGVKQVLDGNLGGVVDSLRVTDMVARQVKVGDVDYLAAVFTAEIVV